MRAFRVGMLLEAGAPVDAWRVRVLKGVSDSEYLSLAAIVELDRAPPEKAVNSLFRGIMALDRAFFARAPRGEADDPGAASGAARLSLANGAAPAAPALANAGLDVIVNLANRPAPASLRKAARLGVWSFSFTPAAAAPPRIFGFDALKNREKTTFVRLLQSDSHAEDMRVVAEAAGETKFSLARTRALAEDRAASLVLRELRLHALGVQGSAPSAEPAPSSPPGAADAVGYGASLAVAVAKKGAARLGVAAAAAAGALKPRFSLYVGEGDVLTADFGKSRRAPTLKNAFYADPFLFAHEGRDYVFFERLDYGRGIGAISAARLDGGGFSFLGDALRPDYHVSYPFIFRHGAEIYMLPETQAAKRIELWRCVDFPLRWELCAHAFEGVSAVDTSLVEHEGAWWLFTNISRGAFPEHCTELEIFRIDSPLLDNPRPHLRNPVVTDVRVARNAGRIFRQAGRLIRPSQDNSGGVYGFGLNLMEIVRLDMEVYEERRIRHIEGSHHLDVSGEKFVFDGRREVKTFGALGTMSVL